MGMDIGYSPRNLGQRRNRYVSGINSLWICEYAAFYTHTCQLIDLREHACCLLRFSFICHNEQRKFHKLRTMYVFPKAFYKRQIVRNENQNDGGKDIMLSHGIENHV